MKTGSNLELINPATGKKFKQLACHSLEETKSKLESARKIQQQWKHTSIIHRIDMVKDVMDYFRENADIISRDITQQMGKPISQSRNEVKGMIQRSEILCGLSEDALQEISLPKLEGFNRFIRHESLGVVLDIAAWNYPLLIAVNVIVPAVLAGNAVVIKHSSLTPLCAVHFEAAFKEAGAPEGLVTALILDHKITESIIQSGLVDHVAFTGSVNGGRKINQSAKNQFINVGLELGGKDPAYVREDANLESAVSGIMDGVFYNAGQSCCAVERIYVHHSLLEEFIDGAIQFMNELKMGDPMDDSTDMGPLAQDKGIKTVEEQLKDAADKGAKTTKHPGPIPGGEKYLHPAILTNVNHKMKVMMEETFAPIVGIMGVESDEEATILMNDSPYGLTASIWSDDVEKAIKIGNRIDTGTFFLNSCDYLDPALSWVGVKNSGLGCTLSALGFQQLTRPKSYHLKLT